MPDIEKLRKNLEREGFRTNYFVTAQKAARYLNAQIDGQTVGFGGSMTVVQMDLFDLLATHNTCLCHLRNSTREEAMAADIYISSLNGVAETGELINIDGTGNRVAAEFYGRKKVYFIIGVNKIAPTFEKALWRARNIAAPKNAQRLKRNTPCAVHGDRCYNCSCEDRICRELAVFWCRPSNECEYEIIIVDDALGY